MALSLSFLLCISTIIGFALSHDRLIQVTRDALEQGDLSYDWHTDQDFVTECALLEMQYLRPPSVWINLIESPLIVAPDMHLCQSLRVLVLGSKQEKGRLPAATSPGHYFFGVRFLEAVMLSVLSYRSSAKCYLLLSYGSILFLSMAIIWHPRRDCMVLLPLPVLLLYAFGLHLFGQSLGHAPAFYVGILALSAVIVAEQTFVQARARWCFLVHLALLLPTLTC